MSSTIEVSLDAAKVLADNFQHALAKGKQPTFSAGDLRFFIEQLTLLAAPVVERQPMLEHLAQARDKSDWTPEDLRFYATGKHYGTENGHRLAKPELAELQANTVKWSIEVEKKLCAMLGREWSASGISINSLCDELQATIARLTAENESLKTELVLTEESNAGLSSTISADVIAYRALCDERDALIERLKGGQGAPVALTVWEGAMPESNGKSNFTAILMRKDAPFMEGITGGICFERSEYPDRVRYEADCMRYLIGELAEEPDMLAYDSEKHSGYVKPSQPAPVSVDLALIRDALESAHNAHGNMLMSNPPQDMWVVTGVDRKLLEAMACLDKVKELNA